MLSTPEGVDRAFKKLDTIKKDIVWWEAGAQPPELLANGEVVMTSAWNGRIGNAIKEGKNFKIVWDYQEFDWDFWAIPAGTKNLDRRLRLHQVRQRSEEHVAAVEIHRLRADARGRDRAGRSGDRADAADLPGQHEDGHLRPISCSGPTTTKS